MQSSKRLPQPVPKPVRWVASSKDDLSAFPNDVQTRRAIAAPKGELALIGTRLSRANAINGRRRE